MNTYFSWRGKVDYREGVKKKKIQSDVTVVTASRSCGRLRAPHCRPWVHTRHGQKRKARMGGGTKMWYDLACRGHMNLVSAHLETILLRKQPWKETFSNRSLLHILEWPQMAAKKAPIPDFLDFGHPVGVMTTFADIRLTMSYLFTRWSKIRKRAAGKDCEVECAQVHIKGMNMLRQVLSLCNPPQKNKTNKKQTKKNLPKSKR